MRHFHFTGIPGQSIQTLVTVDSEDVPGCFEQMSPPNPFGKTKVIISIDLLLMHIHFTVYSLAHVNYCIRRRNIFFCVSVSNISKSHKSKNLKISCCAVTHHL